MTDGSNNYIKLFLDFFKVPIKITAILFSVLIIASCPDPMSDDLLAEVEDVAAPIITITSPDITQQNFIQSQVIIRGVIRDYSDFAGNIAGSIDSAVYVDKIGFLGISGDIDIRSDGGFDIIFDSDAYQDTFTILLTVTDWNGNFTPQEVTYYKDSNGPILAITNYGGDEDFNYYSSSLDNTIIFSGTVGTDAISFDYDVEWSGPNLVDEDIPSRGDFNLNFDTTGYSEKLRFWFQAEDNKLNSTNLIFELEDDSTAPSILSHTFPSDNNTLTLTLALSTDPVDPDNDGIYTTADGATGINSVTEADFDLLLDGIPLTWSFSTAPAEAAESFIINFTGIPATPDGTEILTFAPKADAVFDRVGNPANPAVFLITENLHDKLEPSLVSADQTDAKEITVIFTEDVIGGALTAANYQNGASPATGAIYGGNNATVILTFTNDIVTANNLNITAGVIKDTDDNFFTGVSNWTIDDSYPPYIKDIKVWDIDGGSYVATGLFNYAKDLYIDVEFSETLTGTAPSLTLSGGAIAATFESLIITTLTNDTVRYFYDITNGDSDSLLDINSLSGGSLTDINLNPADLNTAGTFTETIEIDAVSPTVNAGDNKITNSSSSLNVLPGINASANDANSLSYAWTQSGGTEVTLTNADTLNPTVDVPSGADDTYTLLLTVTDAAGNFASDTMILTWDDTLPTVEAGDDKITNSLSALNVLSGTDASANDTNSISYAWTQSGGSEVTITNAATLNPTVNVPGGVDDTYTLLLTVTDAAGNFASDTMILTWDDTGPTVNLIPSIEIGVSTILSSTDDTNQLDIEDTGLITDTNGILSYVWTQLGGSGEVDFTESDTSDLDVIVTVGGDEEGTYTLQLEVTDTAGNSSTNTLSMKWENGPILTDIVFADDGNPGASDGDTITFTFDEEIDPSTVHGSLGNGPSNDVTDTLANLILALGSFPGDTYTTEATDCVMEYDNGAFTVEITLGSVTVNGTQPSVNFEAKAGITDTVAEGSNSIHGSGSVEITDKWDEIAPTITDISASPSTVTTEDITLTITYDEPITTFNEGSTLSVANASDAGIDTSAVGSWNIDNTIYTKIYSISTAATIAGNFTVTVNGAIDLYGNVQTVPDTTNTVTINVP